MGEAKRRQQSDPTYGKVRSVQPQQKKREIWGSSAVEYWSPSAKGEAGQVSEVVFLSVDIDAHLAGAVTSVVEIPGNQYLRVTLAPLVCVQEELAVLELAKQCPGIEVDRWAGVFMVDDQVEKQAGGCAFFASPYDDPKIGLVWMESLWSEPEIRAIEGFVREALVPLVIPQIQQFCEPGEQRFYARRSA
jgi:hypothetical protein